MRSLRIVLGCSIALALLAAEPARAQSGCGTAPCNSSSGRSGASPNLPPQQTMPDLTDLDDGSPGQQMLQDQARLRNVERQKQIVADTQKLLALANELKAEVDKSNKDTLSVDVVKKAEEIEKLAHQVREKMKGN